MPSNAPAPRATPVSIEAVIPVHDLRRPVARTISSLRGQAPSLLKVGAHLEVTVVCHNMPAAGLGAALGNEVSSHVRFVEFTDGVYSPAGPKNHALRKSSSDYLTFVDSDDYLERGALVAWLATARTTRAAAVLAPVRAPDGQILRTPRIRPSKPSVLDPVRDGLATRSLPYGLLHRSDLEHIGFRYTEGLRVGEDLEPTLRLLFSGHVIAYPYGSPAYHQTDDAGAGRVTGTIGPLTEELAWAAPLLGQRWLRDAPLAHRRAIALKLLRIHGIGSLRRRGTPRPAGDVPAVRDPGVVWTRDDQSAWRTFYAAVRALADDDLGALSRRDADLARSAAATGDPAGLALAVGRYAASGRVGELMSSRPTDVLGGDSVVRHYVNERRRSSSGVFRSPSPEPTS